LVLHEKPRDVIALIARYEYNKLDDSATEEKNKKQTQQKRRLAKGLGLNKESDINDEKIDEALVKVKTGEITIDESKYYTADLKEIKNKKDNPEGPKKEENNEKPFLRLDNP
jgi:exopolyphosphatase/pppGpp-phosphohydrolase